MHLKRSNTKKNRILRVAKNLKKEVKRSDFDSLIINMNLHLAWATETGHSFDLAREFKDTCINESILI